nr:putative ribonuclease H-like domain-containing protein [Tanacetum cinerariifolium]
MFRINPLKNSKEDNFMPNKQVKASVRIKPITVSQPHVNIKKDLNSNTNGLSSTGVDNTAKTRRPQPRSNTKNDRVSSVFKNSYIKNKEVKVEEHHKNLLHSNNHAHISSECNNIKFAFQNDKFKVVCAMYLEVAFRRNTYFVRNLERVGLLKGNRTTNLYTINLHEMVSASPICLMARATSTKSKDEVPKVIKTFLNKIQVLLQAPIIIIRTYNGTEFTNQVLKAYFDSVGISHQTSSFRKPQQNGVVKQRNRMLVEAAITMLIVSCAPLFLRAEAIETACNTQNCFLIHQRFDKIPYELINDRKPDISFLHVFGDMRFPKNDYEDIGKLGAKDQVTRSMLREIASLQVMSKYEYVGYEVFQSRSIQDYLKAKDHDIKIKFKDIKLKIKIQGHKHAKGTLKKFQEYKVPRSTTSQEVKPYVQ